MRILHLISCVLVTNVWASTIKHFITPICDFDNILECGKDLGISDEFNIPIEVDPLETEILNWFRGGQDSTSLIEILRKAMYSDNSGLARMIIKRSTRKKSFQKITIKDLYDFRNKEFIPLMKKKFNTFVTKNRLTIVYHDDIENSWYLQVYDPAQVLTNLTIGKKIPLSKCINAALGNSGTVSSVFRGSFHVDTSLHTPTDLLNPVNKKLVLSMAGRVKIGSTAKISGSVTCFLERGNYAQPYMYPFFVLIPEGKRVKVKYDKNNGIVIMGKWEKTRAFSKLALVSPLVECEIGNSSQVCDTGAGNGLHVAELRSLFALTDKNDS